MCVVGGFMNRMYFCQMLQNEDMMKIMIKNGIYNGNYVLLFFCFISILD